MNSIFQKKHFTFLAILIFVFAFTVIFSTNQKVAKAENPNEIFYCEDTFNGTGTITYSSESFNYSTKSLAASYIINSSYPKYSNSNSTLSNCCANVAGSNLIGFYDRYYDNLMPNCTVGTQTPRHYIYKSKNLIFNDVQNLINDLYLRMDTNVYNPGTTQTQFKNGIISYCNEKNLDATFTSVMSGSNFDTSAALTQLQNGNPICLYLSGYTFVLIADNGSTVTLSETNYTGNHICIVFGLQTINYYNASGSLVQSKTYLAVANGFDESNCFYILFNGGTLFGAEAANIS